MRDEALNRNISFIFRELKRLRGIQYRYCLVGQPIDDTIMFRIQYRGEKVEVQVSVAQLRAEPKLTLAALLRRLDDQCGFR